LKKKAEMAAIIGTLQATLTDFRYLRNCWKKNTEEEALLGVSMTGIMDHYLLSKGCSKTWSKWLEEIRDVAVRLIRSGLRNLALISLRLLHVLSLAVLYLSLSILLLVSILASLSITFAEYVATTKTRLQSSCTVRIPSRAGCDVTYVFSL